ncbi:hypothetical protein [Cysteiniphilum sp. 6C5]|uniref:hypothetical protein n=1 Tax=unclassified Cysteiniphilum TaxID=2610889 RepID=UPI003F846BF7
MAYIKSYSKTYRDVTAEQIWTIWSDIQKRSLWDDDTEWATMDGDFKTGNTFHFKPKGGPKLKMKLVECTPNKSFTDYFRLPFGHLYGVHKIEEFEEEICITTTIQIKGYLSWLWQKLLGEKIVATLPRQTELLVKVAREN